MIIWVFLTILNILVIFSDANPFCFIPTCRDRSHTLCRYTSGILANACGRVVRSGLLENEKEEILSFHNRFRKKVHSGKELRGISGGQPAAIKFVPVIWDMHLEFAAQRWANQCINSKDLCRDLQSITAGQSIEEVEVEGVQNPENIAFPLRSWSDQVNRVFRGDIFRYNSFIGDWGQTNEYTQMVWGNTTRIGCGAIRFIVSNKAKLFFVCNYAPRGNIEHESVYDVPETDKVSN